MSRGRSGVALLVAVAVLVGLLAGAAAAEAGHSTSGRVSFYGDLADSINGPVPNSLVIRPAQILLTEDGSVVLEHLRWRSWGGRVAHARGVLSTSDCTPNCAQGHRANRAARMTVSKPGRVLGHRVYRCYRLAVPSRPKSNQHDCLKRKGTLIVYRPVAKPKPHATDARFFTPSRNTICEMFDDGTSQANVTCGMQSPPALASLGANGRVGLCQHRGQRCAGNPGEGPPFHKLSYGRSLGVGRFRCISETRGVTCTVAATGKGFFMSRQSVRRVR